jgi:hypothetical protein
MEIRDIPLAAAGGHGARDDAFVIRVWQALAGIELSAGFCQPARQPAGDRRP